ncbi:MAG: hypothetical protein WBA57_21290 [Elainellaceae cyanobacterium]
MVSTKTVGRPQLEVSQSDLRLIENYAGRGATLDDIATVIGWSSSTLDRRLADTPEVDEAYKRGRAIAKHEMSTRLWDIAFSDKDGTPSRSSITAVIFWLKTQAKWNDHEEQTAAAQENVVIYLPENGREVVA